MKYNIELFEYNLFEKIKKEKDDIRCMYK